MLIFSIPSLQNVKISYDQYNPCIDIPNCYRKPRNLIRRLDVDHSCRMADLIAILQNTPQLTHLTCKALIDPTTPCRTMFPLPQPTYVALRCFFPEFGEFITFMSAISRNVQVLRVSAMSARTYLDARWWEWLVWQWLPALRKFYFRYDENIDDGYNVEDFCRRIDAFSTPFWITRQWISRVIITIAGEVCKPISFRITPCRSVASDDHLARQKLACVCFQEQVQFDRVMRCEWPLRADQAVRSVYESGGQADASRFLSASFHGFSSSCLSAAPDRSPAVSASTNPRRVIHQDAQHLTGLGISRTQRVILCQAGLTLGRSTSRRSLAPAELNHQSNPRVDRRATPRAVGDRSVLAYARLAGRPGRRRRHRLLGKLHGRESLWPFVSAAKSVYACS